MSHSSHSAAPSDSQPEDIFKSALDILIKVTIATVVVVGILISLAVWMAPEQAGQGDLSDKAVAARLQKVGTLSLASAGAGGPRSGEDLYKGRCAGCHDAGLLGAPKLGDKAGWSARIATGYDALLTAVIKGKNAMPAQGGADYSDAELGRALVYLSNASGATFAEPKAEAAAAK